MGLADRDYQKETPNHRFTNLRLTPVVKWLIIINCIIYLLDFLIIPGFQGTLSQSPFVGPLTQLGAFSIDSAFKDFHVWEFITFQFLHGSPPHLIFNCMGLFFFGPSMERWWGSNKFLIFYLICGIFGALFFSLLAVSGILPATDLHAYLVGASAGIYGILIGVAITTPHLKVRLLFPPIELTMRQLAIGVLAFAVFIIVAKIGNNGGGEAGHLGGAIGGFLLVRYPWLIAGRSQFKVFRHPVTKPRELPKLRPRTELEQSEDTEVDRILDKISAKGLHSLTQAERDTLNNLSNRNKP